MIVININEEAHGHIGFALNYRAAIDFLTLKNQLTADLKIIVWSDEIEGFGLEPISQALRKDWEEQVYNLTLSEFNDMFDGIFLLIEEVMYE